MESLSAPAKKEVLIIADSDPRRQAIGGVGIYSYNLARYLLGQGYVVHFIGKKHDGPIINELSGLDYVDANQRPGQSNFQFLRSLYAIAKIIKLNDQAVILSQRPDWLLPFSGFKNKKIAFLHGSHSKNVFLKKGKLVGFAYKILESKGLRLSDAIVSVSEENTGYYLRTYKKDKFLTQKMHTIPVGIDLDKFNSISRKSSRVKYGLGPKEEIIVFIGRLEREKNLKMLIKGCLDAKLKLFIVGDGREANELRQFADEIGCDAVFQKAVPNAEIPSILSAADALALTSLYEGLPTVAIEAMAAGLPVVSTDVGDIRKLVIYGKTGYICNTSNIASKLRMAVQRKKTMRKECLKMANKYSWQAIGTKIIEVIDSC